MANMRRWAPNINYRYAFNKTHKVKLTISHCSRGSQEQSLADSLDSDKSPPGSSHSAPSSSSNRTEGYFQMSQAAQEKAKNSTKTADSAEEIEPADRTMQTDLNSTGSGS